MSRAGAGITFPIPIELHSHPPHSVRMCFFCLHGEKRQDGRESFFKHSQSE